MLLKTILGALIIGAAFMALNLQFGLVGIQSYIPLPSASPTPSPSPTKSFNQTTKPQGVRASITPKASLINPDHVLMFINNYRATNGLPVLTISDTLCDLAQKRANFMATNDPLLKNSSIGHHWMFSEQLLDGNYIGQYIGENMMSTPLELNETDEDVVAGWKSSPPHNTEMLKNGFSGINTNKACVRSAVSNDRTVTIFLIGDK